MVPVWSVALAFVVGLAVGVVGCRLVLGRPRVVEPVEPVEPAAVTEPEPAAPEPVSDDPAAAVDDVVAELERRVKGRRTDGEMDRTPGGRRGRRD